MNKISDQVASTILAIAGGMYLILFGAITLWGPRKVDDTMTIYLWRIIRFFQKEE